MPFWYLFHSIHLHYNSLQNIAVTRGIFVGNVDIAFQGNYMGQVGPKMLIFLVGSLRLILVFSQKALFWIPVMRSGNIFVNSYWGTLIVELKVGGTNRLSVLLSLKFQQ